MPYLTKDAFAVISVMPRTDVDRLEHVSPGFLDAALEMATDEIDARLRKRYAAPFEAPVPPIVKRWTAAITTLECFLKRGVDPNDQQFTLIAAAAERARAEIKEAADSNVGLFDLPLRADTSATGVSKGGPFGYSEQSPYVWTSIQAATAREEDNNGSGS